MSQQTNLNVAPYFDDFDAAKDYHRVLFKPGYPVQARELTGLQSVLQNQIEKFGQHFFKEGAKVIPGNTGYTQRYKCVQVNNNYLGVPVEAYADQLVGTKITGERSGVTAFVDKILLPEDSERGNLTLYINYLNSSTTNNSTEVFFDGENLTSNSTITSGLLGNTTIAPGTPFATTLSTDASATGSAFQIQDGVYFIRGNFVNVNQETLILDQYGIKPNYRVGLYVDEEIINADIDENLNDNSQGFNNYSAPGADRLKISVRLFKKATNDFDDDSFVELATIINGQIKTQVKKGVGGGGVGKEDINDTLARRTYAESGDYYVRPFDLTVLDSLNNGIGNRGIFEEGQFTYGGATASDDLALYKFSPGKAFVRGYELEVDNPVFLDVKKPRTTKTVKDQSIIYNTGPTLKVNRSLRNPDVGIGNTYVLSLRDQRVGLSSDTTAVGSEIGVARVYDYRLESGSYSSNSSLNEWNLALYDVQTYTSITVNQAVTLTVPTFVKGANSGATGFIKTAVSSSASITLYETTGEFIKNEALIIDGIPDGRIITAITKYTLSDVKSVFGSNNRLTGGDKFNADVVQSESLFIGAARIGQQSSNSSTVTSANPLFPGDIKVGNLVQYSDLETSSDPVMGRVTAVTSSNITIAGVTTVPGIVNGKMPIASVGHTNGYNASDFAVVSTKLTGSSDNTLYTHLPNTSISNVDLTDATLTIRKTFTVDITNGQIDASTIPTAGTNETFLAFDEERYALIRSDGTTEPLDASWFSFGGGGSTCQIYGLGGNDTDATLIATLRKGKPKAKIKIKNRVNSITVNLSKYSGSGIGATTLNDGLTYGNYPFGTRVQDEIISLNVPDIIEIHGVFESENVSDPTAPAMNITSISNFTGTSSDLLVGEVIKGVKTGAIAIVAEKLTSTKITFLYKNDIRFKEGERITFAESNTTATISTLESDSFDISANFTYENGQEPTFYDYGRIKRKVSAEEPSKKLKIYFKSAYYDSTDTGDVTTVNSYEDFNPSTEIPGIGGFRATDIIDIRPRTSAYTVAADARSPLEFDGRTFNANGNSSANMLASDESIFAHYAYYQGRKDRVYLTKDGKFQVKYGDPSDSPNLPNPVDDALEIAQIALPPYLYSIDQASVKFMEHKRFRMVDIKGLENRIRSLEYYTSLSLLETNTANLFVSDAGGLNRFKSGFFVDNFSGFKPQDDKIKINNSIDRKYNELRPRHYTNAVDLVFGPVINVDPTADLAFSAIEGNNIRKASDIITLDYSEVEYIKQSFATTSESVTPFLISFWQGTLELTPATDTWIDTVRLDPKIIQTEGDYAATMKTLAETEGVDPQTGMGPTIWNPWETTWTGVSEIESLGNMQETTSDGPEWDVGGWPNGDPSTNPAQIFFTRTTTVTQDLYRETVREGVANRSGTRTIVTESYDKQSLGDKIVSRDLVPYMRSRNVEFVSERVKPLTRLYAFFDGVNVSKYCVPKLIEIEMVSGSFQVGETVKGVSLASGVGDVQIPGMSPQITFRAAQANHKKGTYNAPSKTFTDNPYNNKPLSSAYSSTSTILNVDTYSLGDQASGQYWGWVEEGMVLTGQTSGAEAKITSVKLVSDLSAVCIGSFFIPNPNNVNHPRFETGSKVFTLTDESTNDPDEASTLADESFTAAGTLETVQEEILSIRNARVEQKQEFQEKHVNESLGTQVVGTQVVSQSEEDIYVGWYDPLAQSFLVEEGTGVFVTKCDVFFKTKDDMDIPVVFQIRTMQNGLPTQHILPFSEIVVDPSDVNVSGDGSVATTIEFKAPIYLEGKGTEYAIALASNSTKYSVFISRIGETDLIQDTFISNQPYLGSLFKSQNASTWEPSQWEDLKFTLYRADFIGSGSVELYSPELKEGNGQIPTLMPDSLILKSRKIRVGLGTTLWGDQVGKGYENGNTFTQDGTNATGSLVGTAGTASAELAIANAGIGYTPLSGSAIFYDVDLVTLSGQGSGAKANVKVTNGVAVAATVSNAGGRGYVVGDVVGITTIGTGDGGSKGTQVAGVGRDARFTVQGIGATSELIFEKVQGEWRTNSTSNSIFFTTSAGITTELNFGTTTGGDGGDVQTTTITEETNGTHIQVNHKNHGMYFTDNLVKISGVMPDAKPTKLTAAYDSGSTASISVASASTFTTFEGVGIGTTNTGYLQIGDEIIRYNTVSGNTIGGSLLERGSNPVSYPVGTPVYKYELGGINLMRINKTHNISTSTSSSDTGSITFDSYNIKLDMSEKFYANNDDRSLDTGLGKLYINQSKSSGGYGIKATQNMPYEIVTPIIHNLTVAGTTLNAEMRTITSKSLSGTELPYIDNGFETVVPNQSNYLNTTRMIASKVNEDAKLGQIPGNKSFNMRLLLNTVDSHVSPVIDGQRTSIICTSNRVNSIITDYATDERVASIVEDPTACQYITKEIQLENPATSLKLLVSAHINTNSDMRAFYAISNNEGFEPIFVPFPGYDNLNSRGLVISDEKSDGKPDAFIKKTNSYGFSSKNLEYNEYTFTADKLPAFRSYRIKFVLTSTNQVFVPRVKELRVIALA
tara:strand:+ start:8321 stop:15943 length:7623 start_codon:yes stop_codon:yes gene_type:complete